MRREERRGEEIRGQLRLESQSEVKEGWRRFDWRGSSQRDLRTHEEQRSNNRNAVFNNYGSETSGFLFFFLGLGKG